MSTAGATRLHVALERAGVALHELAAELGVTNDELLATLGFLTEVGRADEMVLLSDVLGLSRLVDDQTHGAQDGTESNVLGPFYRPGAPFVDNPGSIPHSENDGPPLRIEGRVQSSHGGVPLPGAVVDVWHANADGLYSNEAAGLHEWNLRGRQRTDLDGRYRLDTVQPSHYTVKHDGPVGRLLAAVGRHPWRPAHIHFRVNADGHRPLVTQAYLAGGPYLDDDAIQGVKASLVVPIIRGHATFDVTLSPIHG